MRHVRARPYSEHDSHARAATRKLSAARWRSSRASESIAHSPRTWWARANVWPSPSPSSSNVSWTMRAATAMLPSVNRARADSIATRRRTCGGAVMARSTARSMSADASSTRPIRRLAPARSSSSSGSRSTLEPRRASRLIIARGSIVSATDSVRPRIMLVARSWSPASRTSVIASRARPRCNMSSASVPAMAGSTGVPRSAAADASSRTPVTWRRSGTPTATASCDEAGPAESIEHRDVDARGAGEQRDDGPLPGGELVQGRLAGGPHDARGDRHGVGRGIARGLVEGHGDDPDVAVGRLGEPAGVRRRARREDLDDLLRRDRQRLAVDDEAVDELGDLVDRVGEEAAGDDQPGRAAGVLDALAEQRDIVGGEEVGIVDEHVRRRHRRICGERPEVATQAQDVGSGGAARQPRLAGAGRRLEQHDRGNVRRGQPGEQRGTGQAHTGPR